MGSERAGIQGTDLHAHWEQLKDSSICGQVESAIGREPTNRLHS